MNIRVLSTVLMVFASSFVFAQTNTNTFSLQEAQAFALQHNKTLQIARNDVKMSKEQLREATGAGLPQINGTVDYMTNFNYEIDFSFGASGGQTPTIDYTKLDAGDLEILNSLAAASDPSASSAIVMEDQANATVRVSQLIFSGQFWAGLELAKLGRKIAEKNVEISELDIKKGVANSYHLILATHEFLRILNKNKEDLQLTLKHTSDMYKAGLAEQIDVDQLRVNLSQIENSQRSMERNLQINYNMFRFLLGLEPTAEIVLSENLDNLILVVEQKSLAQPNLVLANNPTFQIMETQEEIGHKNVNMQKWAYTPTLSGYYSYTEKMMTSGFDLSPKNAAGLNLTVPIFAGGTKYAQVNKAKIELDNVRMNKELLSDQLMMQDQQLSFEFNNAFDNFLAQTENVEMAKRVFDNINNKYKQGILSSLDLIQANTNYLQAENNYINSVMELLGARLELDKLYNTL